MVQVVEVNVSGVWLPGTIVANEHGLIQYEVLLDRGDKVSVSPTDIRYNVDVNHSERLAEDNRWRVLVFLRGCVPACGGLSGSGAPSTFCCSTRSPRVRSWGTFTRATTTSTVRWRTGILRLRLPRFLPRWSLWLPTFFRAFEYV